MSDLLYDKVEEAYNNMSWKICIVDDFPDSRNKIAAIIKKNTNYEVITIESGVDLLNMFKVFNKSKPDLILLDILMPKMDGFEVAKLLKSSEISREIPIIFVTGLNDTECLRKAFEIGGVDYISKPFRKWELLARINSQLEQKKLYDELREKKFELDAQKDDLIKKNTILETSLEILYHDTKNIFSNIKGIMDNNPESAVLCMIEECLDDLYELTMEAVGYMRSKKRIFSVVDMIKRLRVTHNRESVADHDRIILTHTSYRLLYIETSSLIKNAIINIIENALKYSPKETKIEIHIENIKDKIKIYIRDHGTGIPDFEKIKIFNRNYRINKNKQGTGKGLWITKNIIEKENGKLSLENNEGGGSVFIIELPAFKLNNFDEYLLKLVDWFNISLNNIKKKAENIRTIIKIEEKEEIYNLESIIFANLLIHLRQENYTKNVITIQKKLDLFTNKNKDGKKVLIVDDSIYVHYYLAAFFNEEGYNIVGYALNGKEAIEKYNKLKPDLITMDNTMPIMSGLEAAVKLYTIDKNIKILFITALSREKHFIKNLKDILPREIYMIMDKPINKNIFKKILNKLLVS